MLKRYGVSSALQLEFAKSRTVERIKERSYENFILNCEYDEPLFTKEYYFDHHDAKNDINFKFPFKCKKCGNEFLAVHKNGQHGRCPKCFPPGTSNEEIELLEFIRSIYFEDLVNGEGSFGIIPPYQLDIYVPGKKLAFEFDGLYWHSDDIKPDRKYHLMKTEMCEKLGIKLVHVFENEW